MAAAALARHYVGQPIPRREDDRLTTGAGRYVDDIQLPGMLHMAILRSPHAHARIRGIDTSAAEALPGVHAVITGVEAKEQTKPMGTLVPTPRQLVHYCMAVDKVRFMGEPVATVAADTRAIAEDALDRIAVDYEPLPVAADADSAMKPDAPRPGFFDGLEIFNICDKANVEGPDAKTSIVGTGPFVLMERVPGDHFTFVKNKNYWQSGRPYLDSVVTNVRNQQNMSLQLEGGLLDSVKIPQIDDFARLKSNADYVASVAPNSRPPSVLGSS